MSNIKSNTNGKIMRLGPLHKASLFTRRADILAENADDHEFLARHPKYSDNNIIRRSKEREKNIDDAKQAATNNSAALRSQREAFIRGEFLRRFTNSEQEVEEQKIEEFVTTNTDHIEWLDIKVAEKKVDMPDCSIDDLREEVLGDYKGMGNEEVVHGIIENSRWLDDMFAEKKYLLGVIDSNLTYNEES